MTENWIIPCNTKVFDIVSHFKTHKRVVWKNSFTICKGDITYIYIGSPYSEIRFKCVVVNDKVDDELLKQNAYAIPAKKSNNYFSKKEKYIEMEFLCEFPENALPLKTLKEHGLGQVQIQARTDCRLQMFLDEVERKTVANGGENK